jgi:hypothetical protein
VTTRGATTTADQNQLAKHSAQSMSIAPVISVNIGKKMQKFQTSQKEKVDFKNSLKE